jgi:hypothetical protein
MHLPFLWRLRLLAAIHAKGSWQNRRLLGAWARAEGGTARYNPLNTTQPWPGATDYNSAHVKNYPSGAAGIAATAATLVNGHYDGIVRDLRAGSKNARQIVTDRRAEIQTWGTNPDTILRLLT